MHRTISANEARRLAVASQGFGKRLAKPTAAHVRKLAARVHAFQIDSVNVLVRAHYVPAFARLGPYKREALDTLAYSHRHLFEYWGHEASLLPVELYPLLRYRMHKHHESTEAYMRSPKGAYMARVYAEIGEHGSLGAGDLADPGERGKGWWSWWGSGNGKATLEHLYDAGLVAIAGRRGFERLYDLAERVIPRAILDAPAPAREESMKQLLCLGAKAQGVGTLRDLAHYFEIDGWRERLPGGPAWTRAKLRGERTKPIVKRLMAELVEEGRLVAAQVEGWNQPAYLDPSAAAPRRVEARALLTPFDSLLWSRERMKRVFGMEYSIEIYTPAPKRKYGYYVCPFLLGDELVARVDLKSDRARGALVAHAAFAEPGQSAKVIAPELATALREMQEWLGLERVEVGQRGDLARELRRCSS